MHLRDDDHDLARDEAQHAANALKEAGATSVVAYASHGVLSNGALERIRASALEMLVTTDSIMPRQPNEGDRVRRISIAPLLAEAMTRVNTETSVSSLFD